MASILRGVIGAFTATLVACAWPAVPTVIVGSSTWVGECDVRCDGADDDVEVLAVFASLTGAYGGGVVVMTPGLFVFESDVDVPSGIELRGAGPAVTTVDLQSGACITSAGTAGARRSLVKLTDFAISNSDDSSDPAIDFDYTDNAVIERLSISGFPGDSMFLSYCDGIIIRSCMIPSGGTAGMFPDYAIWLNSSVGYSITECQVTYTGCGIYVAGGSAGSVSRNMVSTCTWTGITLQSERSRVADNECRSCDYGINVAANNAAVSGNRCSDSTTTNIYVGASDATVTGNNSSGGGRGIHIAGGNNNVVTGNRATGASTANFTDAGTGTTVSGNNWT